MSLLWDFMPPKTMFKKKMSDIICTVSEFYVGATKMMLDSF